MNLLAMQRLVLFILVILVARELAPAAEKISSTSSSAMTFFVATNGNDNWSGQQASRNVAKSDGPFATVPHALKAVRELKQKSVSKASATIFIRGGIHFLNEPLICTPADSGLTLAAYRNEKPVLSGGRRITGWKETTLNGRNVWIADVKEAQDGKWAFRELWVNSRRGTRARLPDQGYFKIAELPDKSAQWSQGQTRFRIHPGDLQASGFLTNAEVVAMTRWVESRLPVLSFDQSQSLLTFSKRSVFELLPGDPYYLEGALDFLNSPDEWCLEPATGKVYYAPRSGEKLEQVEVIAPVLSQILRLEGKPEQSQFIERIGFKGLTFSHAEWYFPTTRDGSSNAQEAKAPEVGGFSQAAIGVPGAVWGEGLRECSFENCVFSGLGGYAIELGRGCQSNHIVNCDIGDLGAGGLKIGETGFRDKTEEQARANEISDCHIHDGGKMFHSAIGVWIGQSPDNRLSHDLIHDFYYTGISIGWTWGYGRAFAANNVVEFNHVHHIGVKSDGDGPILSDMGGIYTLGKQPGTRIVNNLWHDIAGANYGGWGIYFDEGSSGILAESNVVYRTTHGGFHQHYGETNMVWNNVFAFARDQQIQRSRVEPHLSFSFETNIIYFDSGNLLGSEWKDDHFEIDWNIYFDARSERKPESLRFGQATLEEWQARTHDTHSIIADPLFVAPQRSDFHLQSQSPAYKVGFRPINLNRVGIRAGSGKDSSDKL